MFKALAPAVLAVITLSAPVPAVADSVTILGCRRLEVAAENVPELPKVVICA